MLNTKQGNVRETLTSIRSMNRKLLLIVVSISLAIPGLACSSRNPQLSMNPVQETPAEQVENRISQREDSVEPTADVPLTNSGETAERTETAPSPTSTPPSSLEEDSVPETPVLSSTVWMEMLEALERKSEDSRTGYERDLFCHCWKDLDDDGLNTRAEVLAREKIGGVAWFSRWDGEWLWGSGLNASGFDIDHIVATAEAWDSGASNWSEQKRINFANDELNLIAVTASSNRSKGARDAAEWQPPRQEANCFFAIRVIQVKDKWGLSVDSLEYESLLRLLSGCEVDVPLLPDVTPPIPSDAPTPTPVDEGTGECVSADIYRTADDSCINDYDSNSNGDINCSELPSSARPVELLTGEDPFRLDGDGDGFGCD